MDHLPAVATGYEVPPEVEALSCRERTYVEGLILDGLSGDEACRRAGYTCGYQTRLRRRPKIAAALRALRLPDDARFIASVAELREGLTETTRTAERAADRTAAAALLLRVDGALGPETYIDARTQTIVYRVGEGSPDALLDVLDALARLAAGEPVSPEDAGRILASYVESDRAPHGRAENLALANRVLADSRIPGWTDPALLTSQK